MAAGPTDPGQRVCPRCGTTRGGGIHCEACGINLMWKWRLPTRHEWSATHRHRPHDGRGTDQEPLRYGPRELEKKRVDPGEFRQGRLPLALMLNEKLGPTEDLIAISRVTDDLYPRWLVITPERVLLLNERYITTLQDTVIEFKRNEISELKARRYLVRSRIAFKVGGERKQLKVLGRDSARKLLEHLSDGSGS